MLCGWFVMQWTISKSHENIGEGGEKLRQKGRFVDSTITTSFIRHYHLLWSPFKAPPQTRYTHVHGLSTRYIGKESLAQNRALASVLEREKKILEARTASDVSQTR